MNTETQEKTRAQLEREVLELTAQLAYTYHAASLTLGKADRRLMASASGCLLQITAVGGREIIPAVMIKDGLSDATIAAIRADIARSFELAVAFKPKGTTP